MSYYTGDYYAGDPGFGGFFKGLLGGAASFIPGVGGGVSKIISKIGGGGFGRAATAGTSAIVKAGSRVGTLAKMHPVITGAGAAGALALGAGALGRRGGIAAGEALAGTKGYHIIKKGPHAGNLTRNRRMRVTNPRALRRAIRRATGFARLARRVLHFTSPRAPKGRAIFKARRKKK